MQGACKTPPKEVHHLLPDACWRPQQCLLTTRYQFSEDADSYDGDLHSAGITVEGPTLLRLHNLYIADGQVGYGQQLLFTSMSAPTSTNMATLWLTDVTLQVDEQSPAVVLEEQFGQTHLLAQGTHPCTSCTLCSCFQLPEQCRP